MKKALPVLVNILERETRGWFLHFRERLIAELRTQKLPDDEIEKVLVSLLNFCYHAFFLQTLNCHNHSFLNILLKSLYLYTGGEQSSHARVLAKSLHRYSHTS